MIDETSTDDIDFLRQLILSQDTPQLPSSASTPDINSPPSTPVIIPSTTAFNIEVNFFSKIRRLVKEEIEDALSMIKEKELELDHQTIKEKKN